MKETDFLLAYVNRDGGHERKTGRYWASEIYSIRKGYVTPDNFFDVKPVDVDGCRNILTGMAYEDMFSRMLKELQVPFMSQEKFIVRVNPEIVIVVTPDFIFNNSVLETKHPVSSLKVKDIFEDTPTIPYSYLDQLECEYRATNLDVYLGAFTTPFGLRCIKYIPTEKRWNDIKETIIKFHNELKEKKK